MQIASAYTPKRIQDAYDYTSLYNTGIDGTGQTIALLELDQLDMSDIQTFDAAYGLPDPVVHEYYPGARFEPEHGDETAVDVEWAHALAPGASLQVYYIDNSGSIARAWKSMGRALTMAATNGAKIVSISLAACDPGRGVTATSNALATLVKHGVSVFVSSGDDGDRTGPPDECGQKIGVGYPSGDPSTVSVGGTSLRLAVNDSIASETGWSLSGGGRYKAKTRPKWQLSTNLPKGTARWIPDVAFVGDPETGVNFVRLDQWRQVAGTSLGAPAWAAIWALVREDVRQAGKKMSAAPKMLYKVGNSAEYATAFHDITIGSNGAYQAGVGWDAVTGWGTPDVAKLAAAVLSFAH